MLLSRTSIDIKIVYVIIVKKNKLIVCCIMVLLYKEVSDMHRITPIPIGVEFYKQMVSEVIII